MNILLIAYYFPPISSGGSSRPARMAKYLPRFGHQVTVITHTYQQKKESNGSNIIRIFDISQNKNRRGFQAVKWFILRIYVEILNRFGIYRSIYDFWKKKVMDSADRIVSMTNPDLIIATYPPVETLELALFFQNRFNIPFITDFRDGLLFEPIEEKRISQYPCIQNKYKTVEQKISHSASAIITVSPLISKYFKDIYGCNNVFTIPNGYDPEEFSDFTRPKWLDNTTINIVYTGRFSLAESQRNIDVFFSGIRNLIKDHPLLKEKFIIHLIGQFSRKEKKSIKDLSKMGLVRFREPIEKGIALSVQINADLLLLFTSLNRHYMAPGKLYEYLYSGTPILALTANTFAEEIVAETGTGWIVHPQDTEKISDFMYKFLSIPEFSKKIHPQKEKIETYAVSKQMEALNKIIKLQKP